MKYYEDCDYAMLIIDKKNAREPGFMLISHGYDISKQTKKDKVIYYVSDYKHKGDLQNVIETISKNYNCSNVFHKANGVGLKQFEKEKMEYWNDKFQYHHPYMMFGLGEQMLQNLIKNR